MSTLAQWTRRIALFAIFSVSISLSGCSEEGKRRAIEEYKQKIEQVRVAKLNELRDKLSSSFLFGALGYVCIAFFAPTVVEAGRVFAIKRFSLSDQNQLSLAKTLYWITAVVLVLVAIFNKHLAAVRPAVFLLVGATAYPFFVHVLPSISAHDKMRRKAAMVQIKSFLMLIFIFYVILRFLSPDGFGEIQIK